MIYQIKRFVIAFTLKIVIKDFKIKLCIGKEIYNIILAFLKVLLEFQS